MTYLKNVIKLMKRQMKMVDLWGAKKSINIPQRTRYGPSVVHIVFTIRLQLL